MIIPQVYHSVSIGKKRSSDASITNFLCGSVGYLHLCIPNFRHWIGFISDFPILFPNHKPLPNFSVTTSTESSVNTLTPIHIGIFSSSVYYGKNEDTVHSSKCNYIGWKFAPKQWVSACLSISVADSLQITLSWFVCNLLMIQRLLVLIFNTVLFPFTSGTRSSSKDLETRLPRRS